MTEQKPSTDNHFAPLHEAEFMVLTTYKRNGVAVPTTVWFAEANGVLYLTTAREAGKTKRIRNNPQVTLAPSDRVGNVSGPAVAGTAQVLAQDEGEVARAALFQKYGDQFTQVMTQMDATRPPDSRVYISITAP